MPLAVPIAHAVVARTRQLNTGPRSLMPTSFSHCCKQFPESKAQVKSAPYASPPTRALCRQCTAMHALRCLFDSVCNACLWTRTQADQASKMLDFSPRNPAHLGNRSSRCTGSDAQHFFSSTCISSSELGPPRYATAYHCVCGERERAVEVFRVYTSGPAPLRRLTRHTMMWAHASSRCHFCVPWAV